MSDVSDRLSMGFSCVGHFYSHLFAPIFFTLVPLALEQELGLSHGETVALIVAGNLLYGLAAPLAGWLGDRWSTIGIMTIFFIGTGFGMVMAGTAETPFGIALWLAVTGLFGSIYHPVGIAWLVRVSVNTGTVLGINGIFGGLGPALAAVMTGFFIDAFGWRSAYIVPGAVIIFSGFLFLGLVAKGWILEPTGDRKPSPAVSRGEMFRVYAILAFTMTCGGLIYHATGPALPKAFSLDFGTTGASVYTVSFLVGTVYATAGLVQVLGGRLADIFPVRRIYLISFLLQVPVLAFAGTLGGTALVAAAVIMVSLNTSGLPAENMLIARYTPPGRRGFVYGLKFVIASGITSLGVILEGMLFDMTGGFLAVFAGLALLAAAGVAAILLLPGEAAAAPQPAE